MSLKPKTHAESISLALQLLTERFSNETDGFLSIDGEEMLDRLEQRFTAEELDEMSRDFVGFMTLLDILACRLGTNSRRSE